MPIYPYVCTACGHEFDALQKMSEDPLIECPQCHAATLRKRLTAPAFKLKGTGWYETDFKHGNKKREGSGKDEGGGKSAESPDGKGAAASTSGDAKKSSSTGESKSANAGSSKD